MSSQHLSIYSADMPELIEKLVQTPQMQRLSDVGMHCGCEYTCTPIYKKAILPYSRLMHSSGVAKIVWNFTKDVTQTAAGLLHDIATPVFAHTIDFMHNDHLLQEATEAKTKTFIENSAQIKALLDKYGIQIDDVNDYHKYPIADNDTPMLSADRLEYTLGNAHTVFHTDLSKIKEIYDDLAIATNERETAELCFVSVEIAKEFAEIALRNSYFYVSDEDRLSMEYLSDVVRYARTCGVLTDDDLYSTETNVVGKIKSNDATAKRWEDFSKITAAAVSEEMVSGEFCVKVFAKKRYIDPLALTDSGAKRMSVVDDDMRDKMEAFLSLDFDKYVYPVNKNLGRAK